jgi:hypothetical protein
MNPVPGEPPAAYAIRRRHEAGELTREAAIVALIEAFGRITPTGAALLLDQPEGLGKASAMTEPKHPRTEWREL